MLRRIRLGSTAVGFEIDRDTRAHWHGPIDEDGQRGRVLLLRPGFEQSREGVGQFFGELANRNARPQSLSRIRTEIHDRRANRRVRSMTEAA